MQNSGLYFFVVSLGLTIASAPVRAQESVALKSAEPAASSQRRAQLRRVLNPGSVSKPNADPAPVPGEVAQRHLSVQELLLLREQLRQQLGQSQAATTKK